MKRLYYWLYIIYLSCKWVFRINLGDEVYYKGEKYIVNNGVPHYTWKLIGLKNIDEGKVFRHECKKVKSLKNYTKSFRSGYSFYMTCWYDIWCRKGIEPWVRNCNIW